MWELMNTYQGTDQRSIQRSIVNHVEYTLARTRFNFDNKGAYQAAAYSVRDRLIEAWNDTQQFHQVSNRSKRAKLAHTSLFRYQRPLSGLSYVTLCILTSLCTLCISLCKCDIICAFD